MGIGKISYNDLMTNAQTVEIHIQGMDCAECTQHVQHAIAGLPGVGKVEVYLATEKAVVLLDPEQVKLPDIRRAVEEAGYSLAEQSGSQPDKNQVYQGYTRTVLTLLGVVFGAVLFVVVVGEWLGLFEAITGRIPWPIWLAAVLVGGYPVFRSVLLAARRGQIISHTLMTTGVLAAMAVGEWATAVVVVFFMRVGDYAEQFTTERARRAVRDLSALAPQLARVERDGQEVELPIAQVQVGDVVIVRPGEKIPVDGEVLGGQATVNQANITGEAMPVEAGPGARVYAATLISLGSVRVKTTQVGADTTFGRVIKLVEQAEAHRAEVQRVADRFSALYLPVVAGVAALTFLLRGDPLATAAVLVVACSCSFALATPIAMLASIGAAARRGLMFKGGKYLETLARADVLLIDKTGTLTLGKPRLSGWASLRSPEAVEDGASEAEEIYLLSLAAAAERYSEHPLALAVREAAVRRGLKLEEPQAFQALPGLGVRAQVAGHTVLVGSKRLVLDGGPAPVESETFRLLEAGGKTLLWIGVDGRPAGVLAAEDTLRSEVPQAIQELSALGIHKVELLTGDQTEAATSLADKLGIPYRAGLLPEDKIRIVAEYQSAGHTVVMVGDGVNDAPALAQADVGIAMGAAGSDVAIEAAHVALMRDDWLLVPQALRIARRTMRVVKMNIGFTAIYNVLGLSLAALGFLPPIFAAAAQSLPDLGILANSSRLLRQK